MRITWKCFVAWEFFQRKCRTFVFIMDRRHFCKIATLATGAFGLGGANAFADTQSVRIFAGNDGLMVPRIHSGIRISIVRKECHLDLQAIFLDDPDEGPCQSFQTGDEFSFVAGSERPPDFCPKLWAIICDSSREEFNSCAGLRRNTTSVVCCPDGTRPVTVRIDRIDSKSK